MSNPVCEDFVRVLEDPVCTCASSPFNDGCRVTGWSYPTKGLLGQTVGIYSLPMLPEDLKLREECNFVDAPKDMGNGAIHLYERSFEPACVCSPPCFQRT